MRLLLRALVACLATLAFTSVAAMGEVEAAEPGLESEYVAAVNSVRAQAGLPPLSVHGELTAVARRHADRMASENRIWHNPNLGSEVTAYWLKIGENVGAGGAVQPVMDAFVASSGHYRNIVDPAFEYIGVGVTWGTDGRMYTAHVFMDLDGAGSAPAPAPEPAPAPAPAPEPAPAPAPARAAAPAPAPAAAPPPPAPVPPPAAVAPDRVATVLALVGALDAGVR